MAYNENNMVNIGQLKALAIITQETIDTAIDTAVNIAKNNLDEAIQALPTEMFLDQANTKLISNFTFNTTTYPGATNPDLNGRPVLVLAVKDIDHNNNDAETITYSFLDVSTLLDNVLTNDDVATNEEVNEMINEVF